MQRVDQKKIFQLTSLITLTLIGSFSFALDKRRDPVLEKETKAYIQRYAKPKRFVIPKSELLFTKPQNRLSSPKPSTESSTTDTDAPPSTEAPSPQPSEVPAGGK